MSDFLEHLNAMPEEKRSYTLAVLPTHLTAAGQNERLRQVLTTFGFLQAKVDALGVQPLLADYETSADNSDLRLIQSALRLSAHLLAQGSRPLWGQLYGRLGADSSPAVEALLAQPPGGIWLRPLSASLSRPGGALLRTLAGHTESVNNFALTITGNQVFSASDDGTWRLWNLDTGEELLRFPPRADDDPAHHPPDLHAIAALPDGRRVVTIDREGTLQVWYLKEDRPPDTLTTYKETLWALAALPDGHRVVTAGKMNTLDVWDVDRKTQLLSLTGHVSSPKSLAVLPGERLASGSEDQTIRIWDLSSGTLLRILSGHTAGVMCIAAAGQCLASASRDGTIRVWDVETGACLRTISVSFDGALTAVAALPDGRRIVSGSWEGALDVWDVTTVPRPPGHEHDRFWGPPPGMPNITMTPRLNSLSQRQNKIRALAVLSDGRRIVSGHEDGTLKVWDVEGKDTGSARNGHTDRVMQIELLPDTRSVVSASSDGTLALWDVETAAQRRKLTWDDWISEGLVNGMAVVNDGKWALMYYLSSAMHVWDLATGAQIGHVRGDGFGYFAVAAVPHTRRVLTISQFGGLNLWDIQKGTSTTLVRERHMLMQLALSPDGKLAFSMHRAGSKLRAWDLTYAEPRFEVSDIDGEISAVLVLPDNRRFVTAQVDGALHLRDLTNGSLIETLAEAVPAMSQMFALDNRDQIVTVCEDGTIMTWDLPTGASKQVLPAQDAPLASVSPLPETRLLIVLTGGGLLKVLDVDTAQEIAEFGGDSPLVTCAADSRTMTIVAGEISGQIHFLRLEGIQPPPTGSIQRQPIRLHWPFRRKNGQ